MKFLKRLLGLGGKREPGKPSGRREFECPKCGDSFDSMEKMKEHGEKAHGAGAEESRVDYEELVSNTISDVKDQVKDMDVDWQKLLKAEEANKDRKTMKQWIEDQME